MKNLGIKWIVVMLLLVSVGEIEAQKVIKMGLGSDSSASFRYPDTSNFLSKILFGDTAGLIFYDSDSPDSIVIDKKHGVVKYRRYDGEMVDCRITKVREPFEFGLTLQVYDLKYRSGMEGRLVILEMTEMEKMILMEWNYNGFNNGYIVQVKQQSAMKMDPLLTHRKRHWFTKVAKSIV